MPAPTRRVDGRSVTAADAWAKCPYPGAYHDTPGAGPCLMCWEDAGDIGAGLELPRFLDAKDRE